MAACEYLRDGLKGDCSLLAHLSSSITVVDVPLASDRGDRIAWWLTYALALELDVGKIDSAHERAAVVAEHSHREVSSL